MRGDTTLDSLERWSERTVDIAINVLFMFRDWDFVKDKRPPSGGCVCYLWEVNCRGHVG